MLAIFTYHLSVKIRITCADDVSDFVFIVGLSNWVRNYSRKYLYVFPIIISKIASTRYICLMGYSFKLFFINILQRPERNIVLWFDHGYCLRSHSIYRWLAASVWSLTTMSHETQSTFLVLTLFVCIASRFDFKISHFIFHCFLNPFSYFFV